MEIEARGSSNNCAICWDSLSISDQKAAVRHFQFVTRHQRRRNFETLFYTSIPLRVTQMVVYGEMKGNFEFYQTL